MNQIVILNGHEQEQLLRAIESAVHVRRRHQLFLWAQGQFFALLPHEILVCLRMDGGAGASHVECLHSMLFDGEQESWLCDQHDGLAIRLATACEKSGYLPSLIADGVPRYRRIFDAFRDDLARVGLRNAIVHGHRIDGHRDASFFVLFNVEGQPQPIHSHLMQLLLPHLHLAFQHIIGQDQSPVVEHDGIATDQSITGRELEVLQWVGSGKSNVEIAATLDISPQTVKNHMKKIFRKFKVRNRAQAVSRAMAMRLLRDRG